MRFTKMEGIGNDYIYINGFEETVPDPAALSVRMSRYHFGCGSDGLIMILPSKIADFRMQMFNNDGSESGMCGNGIRFVQVVSRDHLRMRVWERGTGETLACGTGACASAVACMLGGLCERAVEVALPGGTLSIEWSERDNHVYMTGPATFVYDGEWLQD